MLAIGGGIVSWLTWPWSRLPPDPRLGYPTPYRNVRPGVGYVGDQRCADCHLEITEAYRRHPMGKSLGPVAAVSPVENYEATHKNPFAAAGFQYQIDRLGSSVLHKESKQDTTGAVLYEKAMPVRYAVGSGTRGRSYLLEEKGFVWQSPVSWYTEQARWDLSPSHTRANRHFERPIVADCLFCHANQVVPLEGMLNRYEPPLFRGEAIGCERCHGPGELHVQRREAAPALTGPDDTIVNPRRLEPAPREAVCQQCHLQGEARVVRLGRSLADYRPGLPLDLFLAVFVPPAEVRDNQKAVGQTEQMYASQCFQMSSGQLGCISCHDPHRLPPAEQKAAYFRQRCLTCHASSTRRPACSFPLPARRAQADNCAACHMPSRGSSNIIHASITDHRILRRPEAAGAPAPRPRPLSPDESPLVHFHPTRGDVWDGSRERDLGIALVILTQRFGVPQPARLALPLLETSLQRFPADEAALEAHAVALWHTFQQDEAIALLERLLQRWPRQELALSHAASFTAATKQFEKSLVYYRRLVELNPYYSEYQYGLAHLLWQREQWQPALDAGRQALELNPARLDARKLIILCLLRLGKSEEARAAFAAYRGFQPPDEEVVGGWFSRLP